MTVSPLALLALVTADPVDVAPGGGHLFAYVSALAAGITALGGLVAVFATRGRGVAQGYRELDEQRAGWAQALREDRDNERTLRKAAEAGLDTAHERIAYLEAVCRAAGIDPNVQSGPGRRGGTGGAT